MYRNNADSTGALNVVERLGEAPRKGIGGGSGKPEGWKVERWKG